MRGPFRRFLLVRQVDVSGVSGTGPVAEGVQWSSGRRRSTGCSEVPSSGVYDSVYDVLTVHGRGGTAHPARRCQRILRGPSSTAERIHRDPEVEEGASGSRTEIPKTSAEDAGRDGGGPPVPSYSSCCSSLSQYWMLGR